MKTVHIVKYITKMTEQVSYMEQFHHSDNEIYAMYRYVESLCSCNCNCLELTNGHQSNGQGSHIIPRA